MKKKIFTLIHEEKIHAAPGTKIIPAADFSILQNAEEVLAHVKRDAELYRMEVAEEIEKDKEYGFQKGYEKGYEEWTEKLADFETHLVEIEQDLQKKIISIALTAAKKIVGREIELSEETIVDIVSSSLKSVVQHKKILIYVNKKDLDILEVHKPRLRELFEHLESMSIRPRADIHPGGCVIETEIGIINADMPYRWSTLEKAFENLLKHLPEQIK